MDYPKVNKHTRAPRDGRYIVCPHCEGAYRVYNFAFSSLTCMYCKRDVNKFNFGVVA